MTLETLKQANAIKTQIDVITLHLSQVNSMLDETKESQVKTRVQGMEFELPKAIFKGELTKQKKALEAELNDLETQFNAL